MNPVTRKSTSKLVLQPSFRKAAQTGEIRNERLYGEVFWGFYLSFMCFGPALYTRLVFEPMRTVQELLEKSRPLCYKIESN